MARVKLNRRKHYNYEVTVVDVPMTVTVTPASTTFHISSCSSSRRHESTNCHESTHKNYFWKWVEKIVFTIIGVLVTRGTTAVIDYYFGKSSAVENLIPT